MHMPLAQLSTHGVTLDTARWRRCRLFDGAGGAGSAGNTGGGQGTGDGGGSGSGQSGTGSTGSTGQAAGQTGQGGSSGTGQSNAPESYARDDAGNSLGYPKDTPVASMTDKEAAAYERTQGRKHEGRYKSLVGDRSFDEAKAALDEYDRLQREQQTPAEQALNDRFAAGKKAGMAESNTKAATAIFKGVLEAGDVPEARVSELLQHTSLASFIDDATGEIDTSKLTAFARSHVPGTGRGRGDGRRDFGGGHKHGNGHAAPGSAGQAQAERRFGTKK